MSEQTFNPTQTAYDRIQQAGCRSTVISGAVSVLHVIVQQGMIVRAQHANGTMAEKIISWNDLAYAKIDPLKLAFDEVVTKAVGANPGLSRRPVLVKSDRSPDVRLAGRRPPSPESRGYITGRDPGDECPTSA